MKKSSFIIVAIAIAGLFTQSCTKDRIEGSGNIYYKGHPSIRTDIKGSGTLISSN